VAATSFPFPFIVIIDVTISPRTTGKLRPKEYDLRPVLSRKAEKGLRFTCYRSEFFSTASMPNVKSGLSDFTSLTRSTQNLSRCLLTSISSALSSVDLIFLESMHLANSSSEKEILYANFVGINVFIPTSYFAAVEVCISMKLHATKNPGYSLPCNSLTAGFQTP
jgi:hypothetical protein